LVTESRSIGEILRDAEAGRLENILADERDPYDLIGSAERLFELLHERGIDYVLVGGIAMLQYVEGRNTVDIDLILREDALKQLPEFALSSRDRDFARAAFEGVRVDLLFASNDVFRRVQAQHTQSVRIGGEDINIATPQGLLVLKLFALPSLYRQGENVRAAFYEADIAALLETGQANPTEALAELGPHLLATDIRELRRVLNELPERGKGFSAESPS
jgi:hypothetical protein